MSRHFSLSPFATFAAIAAALAILAFVIFGGNTKRDIQGAWVTDSAGIISGFQCSRQGLAATINNSKRQYTSWKIHKNNLILNGKLFSDGTVSEFFDTLRIKSLTPTDLITSHNGKTVHYKKTR